MRSGRRPRPSKNPRLLSTTYYKNAAFFLERTSDPSRILPTFKAHRECFDEATSRFDPPVEKVGIPYEDATLPGYLFKVDDSGRPRPLPTGNGSRTFTTTTRSSRG